MASESKRQWMQTFEGKIRVGPEYQAMIPPFYKVNYPQSQNKSAQDATAATVATNDGSTSSAPVPSNDSASGTDSSMSKNYAPTTNNNLYELEEVLKANLDGPHVLEDEVDEYIQPYDNLIDESYDLDISNHLQFPEGVDVVRDELDDEFDLKDQNFLKAPDDLSKGHL